MRRMLASVVALLVLMAGVVAHLAPSGARGGDTRKARASTGPEKTPESGVSNEQGGIIISLPFGRRMAESCLDRDGGHQPWRSDVQIAAAAELRDLVPGMDRDATLEAKTCRVVERGTNGEGRPTAVVAKDIDSPYWSFGRSLARVYLFKNDGDVWIATKIVIKEQPDRMVRYVNVRFGFAVRLPAVWVVSEESENGDGVHVEIPDLPGVRMSLSGGLNVDEARNLDDLTAQYRSLKSSPDLPATRIHVGGLPGIELCEEKEGRSVVERLLLRGDVVYELCVDAPPQLLARAREALDQVAGTFEAVDGLEVTR